MQKQEKFNGAAGKGGNGDGAGPQRSRTEVIKYADIETAFADDPEAGAELKREMDEMLAPLTADPTNTSLVMAFGLEPIQELGKFGQACLDTQAKFAEQVRVLEIHTNAVDSAVKKVTGAVKSVKEGLGIVGGKTVEGAAKVFQGVVDLFGGKRKRTEEEKHTQEMLKNLPKLAEEVVTMGYNIGKAKEGAEAVKEEIREWGRIRVEVLQELNKWLGAAPEMLRRYNEMIAAQQKVYDTSQDLEDQLYLEQLSDARDLFSEQYTILTASRLSGTQAAQRLHMASKQLDRQIMMIEQQSNFRANELQAMLADAGFAGSSLKLAQLQKSYNEQGGRILDASEAMSTKAYDLVKASQGAGTVDVKKLLEHSARLEERMLEAQKDYAEHIKKLESDRVAMEGASRMLLETSEKVKQQHILESANASDKKSKKAEKKAEETPTVDDTAVEPPVADNDNNEAAPAPSLPRRIQKKGSNDIPKI